jgi:hypothetical protein
MARMAARRRGERDRGKERFWRRMLRLWRRSGLSIRDFCGDHDLAEPSFYAWRRTIAERDRRQTKTTQTTQTPSFPEPHKESAPALFVPLRVVPGVPAPASAAASVLEVVIGQGGATERVVRVSPGFDAATLRRLLSVLDDAVLPETVQAAEAGRTEARRQEEASC